MLYKTSLFLHVVGALLMCAGIAVEWLYLVAMRKAATTENLRETLYNFSRLNRIYPASMILILIPGIYMMAVVWRDADWIMIGFLGLVLLGLIGSIFTGKKMKAIRKEVTGSKQITSELRSLLQSSALLNSLKVRTTIFLGIIYLMTVRPEMVGSIIALVISAVIGFIPIKFSVTSDVIEGVERSSS